ncbi:MAG: type II secretion system secretin GspD [Kiritimatiellae bacterium]|nr:type II secretion system secretin GspD [Kiritimatiellia bacterium]
MRRSRPGRSRWLAVVIGLALVLQGPAAPAQSEGEGGADQWVTLSLRDAPLEFLLKLYANLTKRTLLQAEGVDLKKNVTAYGPTDLRLTKPEAIGVIEGILAMHNVGLVPVGERLLKVVQIGTVRQEGLGLRMDLPEEGVLETDRLVSQVVQLQHIDVGEAQGAIAGFVHGYGKIQTLERMNSLLITDTEINLKRMMEVIEYIDRPSEIKVEPFVIKILHAKASEIAGKLNQILEEFKEEEKTPTPATPAAPRPPALRGVIRARPVPGVPETPSITSTGAVVKDVLRGKVKVVPDDRSNILIVITRKENLKFIQDIVEALDVRVDPDTIVEVFFLEYAEAAEVASLLSSLIGGKAVDVKQPAGAPKGAADERIQKLEDYAAKPGAPKPEQPAPLKLPADVVSIGELSSAVKIISDKRTNSILISGSKGDIQILADIIAKVDIMLAQVLIEAVILEIGLNDDVMYGIDWLQRSMVAFEEKEGEKEGKFAFAGGSKQGAGSPRDAASLRTVQEVSDAVSGLTYYFSLFDYPIDLVLKAVASSSNVRILSTPIVMTTDNKEASILVGESRPVVTGTSTEYTTTVRSEYSFKDIGIDLKVTPHINTNGFVVMEVAQSVDNVAGDVTIDGNAVPIITKRSFNASIAVDNRSTVVLGGLVSHDTSGSRSKVPLLGDIPLLGMLFRNETRTKTRRELLVLITPYVLMSGEEAETETARRMREMEKAKGMWRRGWSDSALAEPSPAELKEQKRAARREAEQRWDQKNREKEDKRFLRRWFRRRSKPKEDQPRPSEE